MFVKFPLVSFIIGKELPPCIFVSIVLFSQQCSCMATATTAIYGFVFQFWLAFLNLKLMLSRERYSHLKYSLISVLRSLSTTNGK